MCRENKRNSFMNADWSYPLDMCAAHGIIDYDAAADILGQKPRFVGNPKMSELPSLSPVYLPEDTKMKEPLLEDEFVKPDDNLVQNPTWKKVLLVTLAAVGIGAAAVALLGCKGKIKLPKINLPKIKLPKIKMPKINLKNIKMPNFSKFKTSIVNGAKTVWHYIQKPFIYLSNLIKRKP